MGSVRRSDSRGADFGSTCVDGPQPRSYTTRSYGRSADGAFCDSMVVQEVQEGVLTTLGLQVEAVGVFFRV